MRYFFSPLRFVLQSTLLAVLALAVSSSFGQEDLTQRYAAIRADWDGLNAKLDGLAEQYESASAEQRQAIRTQYAELAERANSLLSTLREASIAAYRQAPNQDPELSRLLLGMIANDVRNDQYEEAAGLAQLLIDNKCQEKGLYGLAGVAAYCRDDFVRAEQYLNVARQANTLERDGMQYATDVALAKKLMAEELQIREAEAKADNLPRVLLKTTKGDIVIELYENEAPQTVANFISLVEKGFYNGLTFHRVLPGFMAQGGCPDGTGTGGPGYNIYCECHAPNHRKHFRGTLSMAHAGRDTGGSQFFLTFRRTSHLDGRHTVFGRVIQGVELLDDLQRIDPQSPGPKPKPDQIIEAKVLRKRDHPYVPTKVQ